MSGNGVGSSGRPRPAEELAPQLSSNPEYPFFEYSVHSLTGGLRRDIAPVFPSADMSALLLIPTLQRSAVALEAFGEEQAAEKDRLQGVFFSWANALRDLLAPAGHWIDATDPATGAALFGPPAALYSDVPAIARLLRYPTLDAGGCTILLHPEWKSAVYPATVFTTASKEVLFDALRRINS